MDNLIERLLQEIQKVPLIDPHSHINPHAPAARNLNDLLAYHYYTELAHSSGLPKQQIESFTGLEQAQHIVGHLDRCANTVQYSWLIDLAQSLFGCTLENLTPATLPEFYENAATRCAQTDWAEQVWRQTNLEAIFLTNDFDDPLEGFDTSRYVPCLRTDDLVFKFDLPATRERLARATGAEPVDWVSLGACMDRLFAHFTNHGARACAISLPPDFTPRRPENLEVENSLHRILRHQANADDLRTMSYAIFFALADRCEEFGLPFDLMIGVNRAVYPAGVYQGQDLYDQRTSLIQYRSLFNEKNKVTFPISVLTHPQNQELVSYAWIFPNVVTSGHWWYSNIPAFIERDLRARLEAAPASKQIGYYSDAYKLEFVLPKYNMYRRCLATVLANDFVRGRRWSETRAIELAHTILRRNVERLFPAR